MFTFLNVRIVYIIQFAGISRLFNLTKKDSGALSAQRSLSKNPWRRPTFPHEDMQYHRR